MERQLHKAVKDGQLDVVKILVNDERVMVFGEMETMLDLCLCYAGKWKQLEIAEYCLQRGANAGCIDNNPLLAATIKNNLPMIQMLINHGAQVNGKILYHAAYKGHLEICTYLVEEYPQLSTYPALGAAMENNHMVIAKLLAKQLLIQLNT